MEFFVKWWPLYNVFAMLGGLLWAVLCFEDTLKKYGIAIGLANLFLSYVIGPFILAFMFYQSMKEMRDKANGQRKKEDQRKHP